MEKISEETDNQSDTESIVEEQEIDHLLEELKSIEEVKEPLKEDKA